MVEIFAYCLLGLLLDPEDGSSTLRRNVNELVSDYAAASHLTAHCTGALELLYG
jgi:hypothetical protein